MDEGILVPISLFLMVIALVWLFLHFGLRKRVEAFKTIQLAIEKGQALTPEVMDSMARLTSPIADLRRGIVFVAIAAGFAAFSTIIGWNAEGDMRDVTRGLYGVAMFPLFIGLAFLGLHIFANESKRRQG